ncbi:FecR family protein [Mucilaginibacter flavus]|uniref:FecR family protein n=1 Tax=Mucilaginibacter flavus TaxID=931504 RepID=UPI0025B3A855|nr:FecR family protein [Mucilaginibacter flavus]MDN3582932.1 FecR family protein [Mucilaginibacter flavus]
MQRQKFKQLINKYLNGEASVEEEQLLLELFDSLQESDTWDEETMGIKQQLEERMLQRLHLGIRQSQQQPDPKALYGIIYRVTAAAAVIMAIIGAGLYYSLMYPVKFPVTAVNKTPVMHDADPGKNKAILTLNNGEKVVLDSARIGTLAKNGNVSVTKARDGQLVYTVEDAKSSDSQAAYTYNTISTPRGGQYQVILPDGSKVWLNAASSIKFPTAFAANERNVQLTGEAYFEVTKNAAKPFKVSVDGLNVKVLGTHFNIMAYNDEDAIKTTLLEGSIQLSSGGNSSILKPDQQGIVKGNRISVMDVEAEKFVAWKNGYFEFNRSSILDIMKQLSRWYDMQVVYEGKIADDEFVGRIERSAKLSRVLHILELSHVHFKVEDKKITVSP